MSRSEVERLAAALLRSPASAACPVCGSEKPFAIVQTVASVMIDPPDTTVRALGVACSECGLIRLHAAQVLDQYMDPRADG